MRRSYISEEEGRRLLSEAAQIGRMLTGLIDSLQAEENAEVTQT